MQAKASIWVCGWILLSCLTTAASGQEVERHAVIVGVNQYDDATLDKLEFADADAHGLATLLKKVGYEITLLTDSEGEKDVTRLPTKANIEAALKSFTGRAKPLDTALIAFIGHGVHFPKKSENYFCPRDAKPQLDQTETMIALTRVYSQLDESGARMKVLFADACRNDPESKRGAGIDASTAPQPPQSVVALFSCSKGERSYEHKVVKRGFFTHFLLEGMNGEAVDRDGEVTFASLSKYIVEPVGRAIPRFIGGNGRKQTPSLKAQDWKSAYVFLSYGDLERLRQEASPPGEFTNSLGMTMKRIPVGEFIMGNEDSLGGLRKAFPYSDPTWFADATPQRKVKIVRPFYLGAHEVTVEQFQDFVDSTGYKTETEKDGNGGAGGYEDQEPFRMLHVRAYTWRDIGRPQSANYPVVNVSWNDAIAFCEWLSRKELKTYRLPTEAEWEYACRGGTKTRYWFGNDPEGLIEAANTLDSGSRDKELKKSDRKRETAAEELSDDDGYVYAAPVGRFAKNPFGLYDMIGNVEEWCSDVYEGSGYKISTRLASQNEWIRSGVLRGGNWNCNAARCRSAHRYGAQLKYRSDTIGFRVACSSVP